MIVTKKTWLNLVSRSRDQSETAQASATVHTARGHTGSRIAGLHSGGGAGLGHQHAM